MTETATDLVIGVESPPRRRAASASRAFVSEIRMVNDGWSKLEQKLQPKRGESCRKKSRTENRPSLRSELN